MNNVKNKIKIDDITIYSDNKTIKAIDNTSKNIPLMLFNGLDMGLWHNVVLLSPDLINSKPYILIQNDNETKYNTNLIKYELNIYYASDDIEPTTEDEAAMVELKEWLEINKLPILMFWNKLETDTNKLSKLFKTFKVIEPECNINFNKEWESKRIIHSLELEEYFNSIKGRIIGKTIDKIFYTGIMYNRNWDMCYEYRNGEWYEWGCETKVNRPGYYQWKEADVSLQLDSPVILDFEGTKLEIMYWSGSLVNLNINSINTDKYGADVSKHFARNIIGHKLVDIQINKTDKVYFMNFSHLEIERNDGDDMFDEIYFVFDNGYKLELKTDHCDYTIFSEVKG